MTYRSYYLLLGAIFLCMLPVCFILDTVGMGHFFSSHHLFEHAFFNHFRFGVDIIDNVGPYGFLHYPYTYAGQVYWIKLFWYVLLCGIFAYFATILAGRLPHTIERVLFLFAVTFYPLQIDFPWFSYEVLPRLVLVLSSIVLLTRNKGTFEPRQSLFLIPFTAVLYAFLTLEKASNVYLIFLLLASLTFCWGLQRRFKPAGVLLVSYIAGLIGFWLLARQPLATLPTYFYSMQLFVNAYQANLIQPLPSASFYFGLLYLTICISGILARVTITLRYAKQPLFSSSALLAELFVDLVLLAVGLLSWKLGVIRGPSSYGIFWDIITIVNTLVLLYPLPWHVLSVTTPSVIASLLHPTRYRWRVMILMVLLMITLIELDKFGQFFGSQQRPVAEYTSRLKALWHYRPWQQLHDLKISLAKLQQDNTLPTELISAFQAQTVDEFGEAPEILLLNQARYTPRPIPIDFVVANRALNKKNAQVMLNPESSPAYVLLPEFGIHTTDTLSYLSLLINYRIKQTFRQWVVLEKNPVPYLIQMHLSRQLRVHRGEWVALQPSEQRFLWLQAEANHSAIGRIKSLLYKSDNLMLELKYTDGLCEHIPVSPSALAAGILINPVPHKKSLLRLALDANERPWSEVAAFRVITKNEKHGYFFKKNLIIQLSSISLKDAKGPNKALIQLDFEQAEKLMAHNFTMPHNEYAQARFPMDLIHHAEKELSYVSIDGLNVVERNSEEAWRWATGQATRLLFYIPPIGVDESRHLVLHLAVKNAIPIPKQTVKVYVNKTLMHEMAFDKNNIVQTIRAEIPTEVKPGINDISLVYGDWNHRNKTYFPHDGRTLSVALMDFKLIDNQPEATG